MIDSMKPFRKAVYTVLNGNVTYAGSVVKVYDAKVFTGAIPNVYILMSTQREQNSTDQECAWQARSSMDLLIIAKSGSEVSKDVVDDISNTMLVLLLNLPGSDNLPVQAGFKILNVRRESAVIGEVQISPTQSELQKLMTITAEIYQ